MSDLGQNMLEFMENYLKPAFANNSSHSRTSKYLEKVNFSRGTHTMIILEVGYTFFFT